MAKLPMRRNSQNKFISNITEPRLEQNTSSWPVIKAYAPIPEVWKATGNGTAGVIRQQPNGQYALASFHLMMLEGGIHAAAGKNDASLEDLEAFHRDVRENIPPYQEDTLATVSEYVWGAWAFGREYGYTFPAGKLDAYLSLIPKPPGREELWKKRLVGLGGRTPSGLLSVVRECFQLSVELEVDKELPVITTSYFIHPDHKRLREALRQTHPLVYFEPDEEGNVIEITREYPDSHAMATSGERQPIARVALQTKNEVLVQFATLSMGARAIEVLQNICGGVLRYQRSEWHNPNHRQLR
jgi:hypothetical protein